MMTKKPKLRALAGTDVSAPGTGKGTGPEDKKAAARAAIGQILPPELGGWVQHPQRFLKHLAHGKGPALQRLAYLRSASGLLGYGKDQDAVSSELRDSLAAGSPVDLHREERPTYDTRQQYINQALQRGETTGKYLDPAYEASMRGAGLEGVQGAQAQAGRDESARAAATGIDPRSGIAAQRALQLQRAGQQGRAGVERDIAQANFERQQGLENEAGQQAGLEEGGRHFDTATEQQRRATVEGGLANLGGLGERQRQFDVDYSESQRQAYLSRIANRKAAKALEPSDLEKWNAGIGGFLGGLGV